MSSEVDADTVHLEPCENCGTTFNTLPGHDQYVEVSRYTTTDHGSFVFCDQQCLHEWLDNGGVME